jgi:hypothetical protein
VFERGSPSPYGRYVRAEADGPVYRRINSKQCHPLLFSSVSHSFPRWSLIAAQLRLTFNHTVPPVRCRRRSKQLLPLQPHSRLTGHSCYLRIAVGICVNIKTLRPGIFHCKRQLPSTCLCTLAVPSISLDPAQSFTNNLLLPSPLPVTRFTCPYCDIYTASFLRST